MAKKKKKKNIKKKKTTKKSTKKATSKKKTTTKKASPKTKKVVKKTTKRKKKTKKKSNILLYILIAVTLIIIIGFLLLYRILFSSPIPSIKDVYLDENNNVNIKFSMPSYTFKKDVYCLYSKVDETPSADDDKWVLSENNTCSYPLDENVYYAYLKTQDGNIISVNESSKLGKILSISINKEKVYLPLNTNYTLNSEYKKIGYINEEIQWSSSNEEVASVENGIVTTHGKGEATITASIGGLSASCNVIATNLITKRPSSFDYKKSYLPCNKYTKAENDMIDEILKYNISEAGYKTRAGVVEAARFLTLDFPYRINYFYENGRQTTNKVDGEGRYYHVGFYLHSSRYSSIKGSKKGPKAWGCSLYSSPAHRYINNGLDCSGFVSWALLNGGFDVKDVGAGWSDNLDLTDYGTVKKLTASLGKSNTIKVGDLLHSTKAGGHIGIIVGKDDKYYYIAQALWYDQIGVIITKQKKENLYKEFPHVVLMDKYYKSDGNLTDMW